MDIVGGVLLPNGVEAKVVTLIHGPVCSMTGFATAAHCGHHRGS